MGDSVAPPGFKSPEARRKFFIAAGLAVGAVMTLEVLLWVWASSRTPAAGAPGWTMRLENVHAESAAVWQAPSTAGSGQAPSTMSSGQAPSAVRSEQTSAVGPAPNGDLWYVASEITSGFEGPQNRENNQLVRLTAQGPMKVFTLASGPAWLLPQGDTLWIFASDGVSKYDGKTAAQVPAKQLSESESQPFLLDGQPTAVREEGADRRVVALVDGQWVEKAQLYFAGAKEAPPASRIKLVEIGDRAYVFCPKGDTLYCHEGFPAKEARFPDEWEPVGPAAELWSVAANEGRPEAFTVKTEKGRPSVEIIGFRRDSGAESAAGRPTPVAQQSTPAAPAAGPSVWKQEFSRVSPLPLHTLGAATDGADGCRVVYQALQILWTVNVVRLDGEKVISAERYGDIRPAERAGAWLEVLRWAASGALSVALAFALSGLMSAYRTDGFSLPGPSTSPRTVPMALLRMSSAASGSWEPVGPAMCASLTRRASALLMDAALVLGPLVAGMLGMLWVLPGIEDRPARGAWVVYLVMLLYGGALWALGMFLILCHRLGRTGRTPGKWATGIRVLNTDLAPCGFGRALLRSVLLVVDGLLFMDAFVNFSFGALTIACTLNRQRIGDMAARTIVIRELRSSSPSLNGRS